MKTKTILIITSLVLGLISAKAQWVVTGNAVAAGQYLGSSNAADLTIKTAATTRMTVTAAGRVGINTPTPATTLDVNGLITIAGGSPAAGKVLTCVNANGLATWSTSAAWNTLGNAGTVDGTNYIGTSDNVPLSFRVNNLNAGRIDHIAGNSFYGYLSGNSIFGNTGTNNTGIGGSALASNTTGNENAAVGGSALLNNVSGNQNVAVGIGALQSNTASSNAALGYRAGFTNGGGSNNVFIGSLADVGAAGPYTNVVAVGANTTVSGNTSTLLGANASNNSGTTNATALGFNAVCSASNKVRVGNSSVSVVEGQVMFTTSDGRFKENITEDVKGLDFIRRLRPVVYNFNTKKFEEFLTKNMPEEVRRKHFEGIDFAPSTAIRQSGFIAQEVEKAAQESGYNFNAIHTPQNNNDNYSLAYGEFVVPLVKAVQEQQAMLEQQKAEFDVQKVIIDDLQKKLSASNGINEPVGNSGFSMEQNIPNPFGSETVIKYAMPNQIKNAMLNVYDLTGKQLASFPLTEKGNASITISSDKLAAGIYIYSVIADGKVLDSKRMVVSAKQ